MSRKSAASAKPVKKAASSVATEEKGKKKKQFNPKDVEYRTTTTKHWGLFITGACIIVVVIAALVYGNMTGIIQ